jgi:peptidoglycan/xylan/chitin deacetylase (PgdA/CDA1 family)
LVEVGSHTHNHALLDRLADSEVDDELDRSRELIAHHLGRPADHFAYPKAVEPSPYADRAVRARFRSAALGGTRANIYGRTDVHRLARSPVQCSDGMRWFRHKVTGGLGFEDDLRRIINGRRYAEATT